MKTLKISTFLILMVFLNGTLFAQNKFELGVNGGLTMPTGNLGDAFNVSFNAGAEGVMLIDGTNAAYLDLSYNHLSPKGVVSSNESYSITEISGGYRRNLTTFGAVGNNKLFLDLGAGMYSTKYAYTAGNGNTLSVSSSDFGINFGLGASFPLGSSSDILTRLKFHNIFTDGSNTNYFILGVGINFDLN